MHNPLQGVGFIGTFFYSSSKTIENRENTKEKGREEGRLDRETKKKWRKELTHTKYHLPIPSTGILFSLLLQFFLFIFWEKIEIWVNKKKMRIWEG